MKLRTRLVVSFFLIVFVPILLAVLAFFAIRLVQMKTITQSDGIDIGLLAYSIDYTHLKVLLEDMALCIVFIDRKSVV